MDLTIKVEDYKLNVRAAGIIIHNNKVLTHRNINSDHYTFIGGRVEIGEDSASTVKREIEEEVGKEVEIIEHGGVIENFFEMQGTKYHEMLFMHRAEFVDEEDQKIEYTLTNREGKDYLQYEWIDIDHLNDYPIKPAIIKEILKQGKFPVHMINKD